MKPMKFKSLEHTHGDDALDDFIHNDLFVAQAKVDGIRAVARLTEDGITFLSSAGIPLKSSVARPWVECLTDSFLREEWDGTNAIDVLLEISNEDVIYLDGELLDGTFWLFDMIVGDDDPSPYAERLRTLSGLFPALNGVISDVRLLPTAFTAYDKRMLADTVYAQGGEGIMLKYLDSVYEWGGRVKHSLKVKYRSDADVVVMGVSVGESRKVGTGDDKTAKNNISFGVHNDDGELVEIGRTSSIGKIAVEVGEVVTVRYLYVGAQGRLIQPTIMWTRDDKLPHECDMGQLRHVNKEIDLAGLI